MTRLREDRVKDACLREDQLRHRSDRTIMSTNQRQRIQINKCRNLYNTYQDLWKV